MHDVIPAVENRGPKRGVGTAMKVRRHVALLLATLAIVLVAGCTEPAGTSGPGASAQPAASQGRGDY
jgi:hypothetical protein